MVVMSISLYEQELAKAEMYTKIMEGKAQADNGDLVEGEAALGGLRKKYGKWQRQIIKKQMKAKVRRYYGI